jgi:peptidoglycan/LPS O-acetylase OafA/YrhL
MRERIEELDSLRGLAALVVVFYHLGFVMPGFDRVDKHPVLHFFVSGHESVLFFFVLSGFVLSIPFYSGRQTTYRTFVLRRFFRIYIPYIFSVLFAIVCCMLFSRSGIDELSSLFNSFWVTPFSWQTLLNHLLLVGNFDTNAYNPVIWSLVHEMRISIIFPFIMPFVIKNRTWIVLGSGMVLSIAELLLNRQFQIYNLGFFYLYLFVIGALLAKHRKQLMTWVSGMSTIKKIMFLSASILFYNYTAWFLPHVHFFHRGIIQDLSIGIGVSMMIIFSLSSRRASSFLRLKSVHFFGKISYSLYLYNIIVILVMINLLYGVLPMWLLLGLSLIVSIGVSAVAYYYIERFSIEAGRKLKSSDGDRLPQSYGMTNKSS